MSCKRARAWLLTLIIAGCGGYPEDGPIDDQLGGKGDLWSRRPAADPAPRGSEHDDQTCWLRRAAGAACAVINGVFINHRGQAACMHGIDLQQTLGEQAAHEACMTAAFKDPQPETEQTVTDSEACRAGVRIGRRFCGDRTRE